MAGTSAEMVERLRRAHLYFVCEARPNGRDPRPLLEAAIRGGAGIVQLRDKYLADEELVDAARPFREAADAGSAIFILNDRPDLVAACRADGVHVGQDDIAVGEARAIAGTDVLVGLSTHSEAEVEAASSAAGDARPDQISVGPVWETPTKEGRPATGLSLIEFAARNATVPWFAIGGIGTDTVAEVAAAGASRAVIVRAIRDSDDPEATARAITAALAGSREAAGARDG
jgi:thiamine-phosphate pyrophosphorylase